MLSFRSTASLIAAAVLLSGGSALAAPGGEPLAIIAKPARDFDRSLELGALTVRYQAVRAQARDLGAAPGPNALRAKALTPRKLRSATSDLAKRVAGERAERRRERRFAASAGSVAGVSLATLNSIASCESGGNPRAVNAAGYYGKYQFDMGTWASVGGSGNPAQASEAEQDYRAALLYSRAGSSPWPVCGS